MSGTAGNGVANRYVVGKLVLLVVAMFGFGYAMVPIYKAICDVTGINLLTKPDDDAAQFARNTQVDTSRKITVEFDSNTRGTWRFKPEKTTVSVHPGELVTVVYDLVNTAPRPTIGQAIPSYLPTNSAGHFRKIECFCFNEQALGPNETRQFPVVFVIDPKLPRDINTITLSYTFLSKPGTESADNRVTVGAKGGQS